MAIRTGRTGGLWNASSSKCGFNIISAGFANPVTATSFSATVGTSAHLSDIVAKGVEWVRVPIDPTGALAATDSLTEAKQLHYARDAIKRCVDKGLKVMLSVHISSSDSGWTFTDIAGAYPSGAKFRRYLSVIRRYGEMTKQFPADKLVVLLWNEVDSTASSATTWNGILVQAEKAFRSTNRRLTVAISGNSFSDVTGLTVVNPNYYGVRTLFCFTPYEPHTLFSHQGITTDSVLMAISRLPWPPILSEQATVNTNIDASSATSTSVTATFSNGSANIGWTSHGLSLSDPVYFKTSGALPTGFAATTLYFVQTVVDANTIKVSATSGGSAITAGSAGSGTQTGVKGNKALAMKYVYDYMNTPYNESYVDTRVNNVSTWASSNRVHRRRIVATEYGCHGDFSANGASESSRASWFANMRNRLATKGYAQGIWHYENDFFGLADASFVLNDRFLAALNLTASTTYETAATTLFAADSVQRSAPRKAVASATIKMLTDAGIWAKLVYLYALRAETQQQGTLNWKNPGTNTLTAASGALNWVTASVGRGLVPSLGGTDQYSLNLNDNAAGLAQNSSSFGLKRLTATSGSSGIDFSTSSFGNVAVDLALDSQMSWMGASGQDASVTNPGADKQGLPRSGAVSRTVAGSYRSYRNGCFIEQVTHTSSALSGNVFVLAAFNSPLPNGQFSYMWGASGLTDSEIALLHVIMEFYDAAF